MTNGSPSLRESNGLIFSCLSGWIHGLISENEIVAFGHFARRRHGAAAGLWAFETRGAGRRRAQISAQLPAGVVLMLLATAVVRLERQHRADCGFFRLQALYARRVHRGGDFVVHLRPGFSGRARPRRADAAAGETDGGHRASASGRIAVGARHSRLGLRVCGPGHLVHRHAVAAARYDQLGDGNGGARAPPLPDPAGIRGVHHSRSA